MVCTQHENGDCQQMTTRDYQFEVSTSHAIINLWLVEKQAPATPYTAAVGYPTTTAIDCKNTRIAATHGGTVLCALVLH